MIQAPATRIHGHLKAFPPHSWRADTAVPRFPDEHPLVVFDGVCVLCSRSMRFIAARDHGQLRFVAAQSPLGAALYRHFKLDPVAFETVLLIENGRAMAKLDAFAGLARLMGGGWHAARCMRLLPNTPADWLYDRIAKNRYALFGRHDQCIRPDASWQNRVLE
jgi:predicted DCC family thiol-disulfide oxidoreductase YuxK